MQDNIVPYSYECLNAQYGRQLNSFLHIATTDVARYFKRYLLQEILSVFDFTLPETWDVDYFRYVLIGWGFICILNTDKYGTIPQQCSFSGQNVFYRPIKCIVSNPLLRPRDLVINKDCALIKMMPDYGNLTDMVDNYGNMLALAYETASINILNSRLSYVFPSSDKQDATTNQAFFDEVASGRPAIFYRPKKGADPLQKPYDLLTQNVGQNFIAPAILDAMETIRDMFLTDIGIPNLSTRKKERVSVMEAARNSVETQCKAELWLAEMQAGMDKAIELFPELAGQLSVKLRYKGGVGDVGETVNPGTI